MQLFYFSFMNQGIAKLDFLFWSIKFCAFAVHVLMVQNALLRMLYVNILYAYLAMKKIILFVVLCVCDFKMNYQNTQNMKREWETRIMHFI